MTTILCVLLLAATSTPTGFTDNLPEALKSAKPVATGHAASGAEAIAILPLIALCAYMIIAAKRK